LIESNLKRFVTFRGRTSKKVVSCEEAANARGISENDELKTLLLTGKESYFVHLAGNKMLNLRSVKKITGQKNLSIASEEFLSSEFDLSAGTVTPLNQVVWSAKHVVDYEIFEKKLVYTNDGTLDGYIAFSPSKLFKVYEECASLSIGAIARD